MKPNLAECTELLDSDALELLSSLLIVWCRRNKRDPDELLPKCAVILQRYRNGEYNAERLFGDL
jgi:hypothetical protein